MLLSEAAVHPSWLLHNNDYDDEQQKKERPQGFDRQGSGYYFG